LSRFLQAKKTWTSRLTLRVSHTPQPRRPSLDERPDYFFRRLQQVTPTPCPVAKEERTQQKAATAKADKAAKAAAKEERSQVREHHGANRVLSLINCWPSMFLACSLVHSPCAGPRIRSPLPSHSRHESAPGLSSVDVFCLLDLPSSAHCLIPYSTSWSRKAKRMARMALRSFQITTRKLAALS
jgi:hypothetical protein